MAGIPMTNPPPHPTCRACRLPYPETGLPEVCPRCGGFWTYDGAPAWGPPGPEPGLRRWAEVLGLDPSELPLREVASPLGRRDGVWLQHEGSRPAGSYKERGAEVLAAVCARRGLEEVFLDSSGNAGLAVARACAARGIRCRVLVPESTPEAKRRAIGDAGGRLEVVAGDRAATAAAAEALRGGLPYASHIYQPFFALGVATLVWDVARQLTAPQAGHPWLPGHWVLPAGNGALLLGVGLGLAALLRQGQLGAQPVLHAVQLAGYASLSPAGPGEARPGPPTAAGIAIARPPRREEMGALLTACGGDVTVVTEGEIAAARSELAAAGHATDPTGAAAWAGLARRPEIPRDDALVLLSSRAGG